MVFREYFGVQISENKLLGYTFHPEISQIEHRIVFGKCNNQDLFIDLSDNETVYIATPTRDIFLNSSFNSFIEYIDLYIAFVEKLAVDRKHKNKYLQEWKGAMIKADKRASEHKDYYWGAYFEDYETGMLL